MTYNLGAIQKALKAIVDQLKTHQVSGGKLVDVENILIGPHNLDSGGWNTPLIIIRNINFSSVQKTTASYLGQDKANIDIEFSIVAPKLMQSDKVSVAENIL